MPQLPPVVPLWRESDGGGHHALSRPLRPVERRDFALLSAVGLFALGN
jgi:hypothetical protein